MTRNRRILYMQMANGMNERSLYLANLREDSGFGGLVVSMLASGTKVRGFNPGRSRRIFRAKKSSACLPLEGK
jgi:hypothetical protein